MLLTHLLEWNFPENPSKFLYACRVTSNKLCRLWGPGPNNRQAADPSPASRHAFIHTVHVHAFAEHL